MDLQAPSDRLGVGPASGAAVLERHGAGDLGALAHGPGGARVGKRCGDGSEEPGTGTAALAISALILVWSMGTCRPRRTWHLYSREQARVHPRAGACTRELARALASWRVLSRVGCVRAHDRSRGPNEDQGRDFQQPARGSLRGPRLRSRTHDAAEHEVHGRADGERDRDRQHPGPQYLRRHTPAHSGHAL